MPEPLSYSQARQLHPWRQWFADHPQGSDALVIGAFGVGAALDLISLAPVVDGYGWLSAAYLGTAVLLMFRRRYPLLVLIGTVACALIVTFTVMPGSVFGVALAMYAVSSLRPAWTSWLAFVGATSALWLATVLWAVVGPDGSVAINPTDLVTFTENGEPVTLPESEVWPVLAVLGANFLVSLLIAHAIGLSVRARREQAQNLVDHAHQVAQQRDQQEQFALIRERSRIAGEMHDVVAHSLAVMIALSDGAQASLARAPERSQQALTELSSTGRDALADMRRILGVLRDDDGEAIDSEDPREPTSADLDALMTRFRVAGLPVRFTSSGAPVPQVASLRLAIYRIVQESLTNVLRHVIAPEHVEVRLQRAGNTVTVDITDIGGRPSNQPGTGLGLLGIQERAATHSGTVDSGPVPGGWRVRATLHIFDEEAS